MVIVERKDMRVPDWRLVAQAFMLLSTLEALALAICSLRMG
jgi:hypothetical protein